MLEEYLKNKDYSIEILREPEFDLTLTNDNLEVAKKESYDIVKNFLING